MRHLGPRWLLGSSATAAIVLVVGALPAAANSTAQSLPFTQAWTSTGLVTVDDDWSGVPGIVGYRGDGLTAATATDPRTIVADGTSTPIDVNANQTNPNTFTTGGVAEFELADPAVALNGSGTADAPFLLFNASTTGQQSVSVSYNLRDLDGSADDAVQPVALQYRVGSGGDFTDLPAGFVADATTGPSLATLVTPVSVMLPAAAANQPLVQIRVITTNAVGNDEWVGVDDISVIGTSLPGVNLSVNDVPLNEGNASTTTFTFTVSLSSPAPTGGVTFDIATQDSSATVGDNDYVTNSLSGQTIPAGSSTYPFSVTVNGDTTVEPNETFFVNVTNVTGATVPDGQGQGTIQNDDVVTCGSPFTAIHTIQGSGLLTPIPGIVSTEGIVVGDFEGIAAASGFYLQDPAADADPATSEGIFVFTGSTNTVSVGDKVRVTGYARERFNQTTINGSNSNTDAVTGIVLCSTGNPLPAATDVTLPFADANYPERYEGMLVRFSQPLVIAEYFNYDRFGEIVLANPLAGETRPFTGTAIDEPGAPANARTAANALSRITLDDAQSGQNPPFLRHPNGGQFGLANLFRGGDFVTNAVGVLGYDFGLFRIVPTGPAAYFAANPRPAAPEPVGGTIRVAAMNTLNFFVTADYPTGNPLDNKCGPANTLECRGWDSDQATEFTRQRDKLLTALSGLDADVLGLNELENSAGVEPLDSIVSGLPGYAHVSTGTIGTDAIKVGLIYRPAVVTPVGAFQILDSSEDPRFNDTRNRPALAQTFEVNATGARFTVAVNHLKSKGSACGVGDDDLVNGQGNCSETRRAAAEALVDWLATDPTGSGDPDFLIMGDLNSYAMEDTIDEIKAGPDGIVGTPDDYTNLISHFQGTYAYSYTFDGQAGYLDHALANTSLFGQVTGATEWHINSDESDVLDYDTSFKPAEQEALYEVNPFRTSDHDPVVVGLGPLPTYADLCRLTKSLVTNAGVAGALCAKLDAAAAADARGNLNARDGQLRAYRNQLDAQAGKAVSVANAALLKAASLLL
jgi:predicted extracellular nuclease